MAFSKIGEFEVMRLDVMDEDGRVDWDVMPSDLSEQDYRSLYEHMLLARIFDEIAVSLQREGRIMTYPSSQGQEAAAIGSAYALEKRDWIFPSFRESGACIMHGYSMEKLFQFWSGDERGGMIPEGVNCFTMAIPVATQLSHATGFAWASKLKGDDIVTMVYFGDGASSKGDVHESMNFAGINRLPIIFACQNNQWAISVPFHKQSASKSIAQRSVAYDFKGIQVDGNDVFAVYAATKEAVKNAREGKGPVLLELVTYRMSDHTTADDWRRYRKSSEVEKWRMKDPLKRMRRFLERESLWDQGCEDAAIARVRDDVLEAVKTAEGYAPPVLEDIFLYHYEEIPPKLKQQMEELRRKT